MRSRIAEVLRRICEDRALEARWLNTVSLMEFVGARKISRTVADRHPSREVLQHLADETRHALAFKQLACDVAGGEVTEYLCPEAAATYFQTLDRALAEWARALLGRDDVQLNYLLTTTMIELRAMQIYPMLKAASKHPNVREELGRVVVEEQSHRREIEERCEAWLTLRRRPGPRRSAGARGEALRRLPLRARGEARLRRAPHPGRLTRP